MSHQAETAVDDWNFNEVLDRELASIRQKKQKIKKSAKNQSYKRPIGQNCCYSANQATISELAQFVRKLDEMKSQVIKGSSNKA
jgi:hypothetical protein